MEPGMILISYDENFLSNLPPHIIIDILTRLSTKTISRCCCVCQEWRNLVSGPEFANLRKSGPPTRLMIYASNAFFNMVELEDEPTSHDFYCLPGSEMKVPKEFMSYSLSMFGSINGLLCFHEFGYRCLDRVLMWNPTTHESITIPSPGGVMEYPNTTTHGFGLSPVNRQYKVVRIYQELEEQGQGQRHRITNSECHVYTLGQGCWRQVRGHAPFRYSCRTHGVFLNGNLHWLIVDPDGTELISCFNLENESFKPFPAPPGLDKDNLATLAAYKDHCLSVCDNTSDSEIVIWVMKEYGVKESWAKEFVIDKHPINQVGKSYVVVNILKVFDDGEILMMWRDDKLLSYNPKSNFLKVVEEKKFIPTPEIFQSMEVVDYVPTFLSLKSFGSREIVEDVI